MIGIRCSGSFVLLCAVQMDCVYCIQRQCYVSDVDFVKAILFDILCVFHGI